MLHHIIENLAVGQIRPTANSLHSSVVLSTIVAKGGWHEDFSLNYSTFKQWPFAN